ncbi:hypothetical protein BJV74DRAFT_371543 [Russula compacta]|nr:hypothetical protein BJV74DRAFT_371543 [Russula compacta]
MHTLTYTDRCLFRSSQRLDRISRQVCFVGPRHTSSLGSVGRCTLTSVEGREGEEELGWGFSHSAYPGAPQPGVLRMHATRRLSVPESVHRFAVFFWVSRSASPDRRGIGTRGGGDNERYGDDGDIDTLLPHFPQCSSSHKCNGTSSRGAPHESRFFFFFDVE